MQQQAMRRSKRPALLLPSKCEISTEAAQAGTTTIVEAKAVETRKGVGRETDTTREIETVTDSVTFTNERDLNEDGWGDNLGCRTGPP
jgi:hypothetical protein